MRVLVVDDTVLFRRVVGDALSGIPGVEVVGSASNGKLALTRLAALAPDLITLDIEMPEMNGIEVLEAIRASGSTAGTIVLSAHTVSGAELTLRALELGAFDFITKPEGGSAEQNIALLRDRITPILRAFERRREVRSILEKAPLPLVVSRGPLERRPAASGSGRSMRPPLVLIGCSTGGPTALAEVLSSLPGDFAAPVLIVQHMPPLFTEQLAERLQSRSALRVKQAANGDIATPGCAYVAPGGRHMKIAPGPAGEVVIRITDDPPENNCRPSVDCLFRSAALQFPGRTVAAILTGMGSDGTEGLKMLKRSGCSTIAQDAASCVVFGMPREAILAGVVDTVVPLGRVAATLVRQVAELRP